MSCFCTSCALHVDGSILTALAVCYSKSVFHACYSRSVVLHAHHSKSVVLHGLLPWAYCRAECVAIASTVVLHYTYWLIGYEAARQLRVVLLLLLVVLLT